jgi:pimeloyl-ACP methyl ester carboxylesterase
MKIYIDDICLNYYTYGQGTPIICIHGWNESGISFKTSKYQKFLKQYKVYAIDLPGFGQSSKLNLYNIDDIVVLIDNFAKQIGLTEFHLLGQCMGCIFALDYYYRFQEKVRNLILVEAMFYKPFWAMLLKYVSVNKLLLLYLINAKKKLVVSELFFSVRGYHNLRLIREYIRKIDVQVSISYIELLTKFWSKDNLHKFENIDVPLTVINGKHTFRQVKKTNILMERLNKDVRRIEVEGKNHFVFY